MSQSMLMKQDQLSSATKEGELAELVQLGT